MVTSAIAFPLDRADAVDEALAKLVPQLRAGGAIRDALRGHDIHFMTITVVRGDAGENTHLVFEISADGRDEDELLQRVANRLEQWLLPLFETAGIASHPAIHLLFPRHRIRTGLGLLSVAGIEFRGTPGMSVKRIHSERDLAREVRDYFDAQPAVNEPPLSTLHRVRDHIRTQEHLKALLSAASLPATSRPQAPLATRVHRLGHSALPVAIPPAAGAACSLRPPQR